MRYLLTYLPISLLLFLVPLIAAAQEHDFLRAETESAVPNWLGLETVKSLTHTLAADLRVAFGSILLSKKTRQLHRKVKLSRRDGNQAVLSEYCTVGLNGASKTTGGSQGGGGGSTNMTGSASIMSGAPLPTASATSPNSKYNLVESHQGQNFFDGFEFFTGGDPTNGIVNYVDAQTAFNNDLVSVADDSVVMRLETTQTVQNTRQSVRITTNNQYSNGAMFVLDLLHMPTGCGTWPAFWTNGGDGEWPASGEIDIIEGVGDYVENQATIHSAPGCTLPSGSSSSLNITGTLVGGTDCAVAHTNNQGCGVRAAENDSFGAALNGINGGVYVMKWDEDGISVYFFPRSQIPSDISSGAPNPDAWPKPMARWPSTSCDTFSFFRKHSAIINTTLCGDWQGGVWSSSGIPGQEQSCAARTGVSTCEDYVRQHGDAFKDAYWQIKSLKIYKQK